jgi:hypothetical protein
LDCPLDVVLSERHLSCAPASSYPHIRAFRYKDADCLGERLGIAVWNDDPRVSDEPRRVAHVGDHAGQLGRDGFYDCIWRALAIRGAQYGNIECAHQVRHVVAFAQRQQPLMRWNRLGIPPYQKEARFGMARDQEFRG